MASSMIHIAIANEINKVIKKDKKSLLIGSIAPDIGKHVGIEKVISHFEVVDDDIPKLDVFLDKYKAYLNDDFVLGYYIHLYTDYLWFKYFIPDFFKNSYVYKLDGTKEYLDGEKACYYIYNDYTNLNIKLIDEYNLDLDIFYEEVPVFNDIIKEIPMKDIKRIVDKTSISIENTKKTKPYVFDMELVNKFIRTSVDCILSDLKQLGIY